MENLPKLSLVQVFVLCICAWVLGSTIIISELKKGKPTVAGISTTATEAPTEGFNALVTPSSAPTSLPTVVSTIAPTNTIVPSTVPTVTQSTTFTPTMAQVQNVDNKYCESADDCVAVSCGCSCSGCGGFSYQDVVNKSHEGEWYDANKCEPAQMCPQVCCMPATIACENHQCVVHGGDKN